MRSSLQTRFIMVAIFSMVFSFASITLLTNLLMSHIFATKFNSIGRW